MERTLKNKLAAPGISVALVFGGVGTACAASFGNSKKGVSSNEVLQVRYDGAA